MERTLIYCAFALRVSTLFALFLKGDMQSDTEMSTMMTSHVMFCFKDTKIGRTCSTEIKRKHKKTNTGKISFDFNVSSIGKGDRQICLTLKLQSVTHKITEYTRFCGEWWKDWLRFW